MTTTTAPWQQRSPIGALPFTRLVAVEARKMVDTRAGRVLLATAALLTVLEGGLAVWRRGSAPLNLTTFLTSASLILLTPTVGVLALSSEWTHRTALVTFTLEPRRERVYLAKLAAAVTVGAVLGVIADLVTVASLLTAAATAGSAPQWSGAEGLYQNLVGAAIFMLLGAALGAATMSSAPALVAYYCAPIAVEVAGNYLPGNNLDWINGPAALARLAEFDVSGHVAVTLTATAGWILLPLLIGWWRLRRRDIA